MGLTGGRGGASGGAAPGAAGGARVPRSGLARWVVGMALFWPVVSSRNLGPATLLSAGRAEASVSGSVGAADLVWAFSLLAAAAAAARLARCRGGRAAGRAARAALCASGALLAAGVVGFALAGPGAAGTPAARAAMAVLSGLYTVALTFGWARQAEEGAGSGRLLPAVLFGSFVLTVPLVSAAQALASAAGIGTAGGEALLPLASGAVLLSMPRVDAASTAQDADSTAPRRGRVARTPAAFLWLATFVYALLTTVLRVVSMVGLEPEETLTKSGVSKVMLAVFAVAMLAASLAADKGPGGRGGQPGAAGMSLAGSPSFASLFAPWALFTGACLAVLYASVAFFQVSPWLCREVIFPSRMSAYMLLFVLAVAAALQARVPAAPTACLLFAAVFGVQRLLFVGVYAWVTASTVDAAALVLPLTAATALATTACAVLCAWRALGGRASLAVAASPVDGEPAGSAAAARAEAARAEACRAIGREFSLTEREVQVLELLSRGYGQKRVADELGLAPNTVHSYAKALYAKTGIHGRQDAVDLVARAMR